MTPVLAPFPEMLPLAETLAPLIGADLAPVGWHQFPDGESLVTLDADMAGRDVAILCTLRDPDRHALPLRFAAETTRDLGAVSVGLIAPYLGYMRQDRRFAPGQAVSAPLFAAFLQESFDWLVTADPHLHRIPSLDRLFTIPARRVVTAPLLAEWIAAHVDDPVLLGPDSESQQWVAGVAARVGCPYEVLRKHRSGDRSVEISVPDNPALRTGTPVILDDIASSGRTLVRAIERLREAGTRAPVCVVIHAVFAGQAHADILAAGARQIVTTNSIPHASNAIDLSPLIAGAVAETAAGLTFQQVEAPYSDQAKWSKGSKR
ncbi:ribose-phosphate diphosphokinase [Ruegeria sp. B32]|uniref:ribose-phosphate diphosphokinase n=1 Tax=Ruegeria sp. B32 TaxID=2867020 RepID=UPI0021A74D8C|nr:ribose-phosphate diphosphokinase [Ruegeria sp. B32]UWR09562.1 ribose-phosphate diphosphokinase [Ruegeria sp. B32]